MWLHEFFLELLGPHRAKGGLLVQRVDGRPLDPIEERNRWRFIQKCQPENLSLHALADFYPRARAVDPMDRELWAEFVRRLPGDQDTGDPFRART